MAVYADLFFRLVLYHLHILYCVAVSMPVKLLQLPQPQLRTRTYAHTYPIAQRATHLKSVLAHVYSISIQNLNITTVP
jgi:hypothetical protein